MHMVYLALSRRDQINKNDNDRINLYSAMTYIKSFMLSSSHTEGIYKIQFLSTKNRLIIAQGFERFNSIEFVVLMLKWEYSTNNELHSII